MVVRLARLTLALQVALALIVCAHAVIAQVPQSPFVRFADDGTKIHIVPTQDVMSRIPTVRGVSDTGTVEGNATVYASPYGAEPLTDHGGLEMANARVQAVYWNTSIANATATSLGYATIKDQMNAFLNAFSDAVNWRDAATADYTIVQQYGSGASIAPTLGNVSAYVDAQTTTATITDAAIRTYLIGRFNAQALTPSASTLFAVFFPPGMTVNAGGSLSCNVFCGYHSYLTYNGTSIPYAVLPYLNCSGCPFTLGVSKTVADQLTVVMSHEIREAVTDPFFNGWYADSSGDEADDKCNGVHTYQMATGGFWVQPEWSNGGTVTRSGFTATYPGPGCVVPSAPTVSAPSAPTGVSATASGTSTINLSWTASSGATSYLVKRSTTSGAEVQIASGVTATTYADTSLSSGTTYYYVVTAVNSGGSSGNSSEVFATTTSVVGAPTAPSSLFVTLTTSSQVSLAWSASSGATSYVVRRGTTSGVYSTIASAVTATSYADSGLSASTQYFYVIAASNGSGTSANSAPVSVTTSAPPVTAPTAPTSLTATATNTQIDLSWTASSGATSYIVKRGTSSGTETTLASGVTSTSYSDTSLAGGTYYYVVAAVNSVGTSGNSNEAPATVVVRAKLVDYDGDSKSDFAVYRPSAGAWFILRSSTNFVSGSGYNWGQSTDSPVAGDFDGDGKTDIAVYRGSTGEWFILKSSTGFTSGVGYQWGTVGDVPVPGDYDGDGKTDLAVYRPSRGEWFVKTLSSNYTAGAGYQWGAVGDVAVPGDYDGDRKTDLAVFRPTTGEWFYKTSSSNYTTAAGYKWGAAGDTPVTGDFDGDGKTDLAVYRPSTGAWFLLTSSSNFTAGSGYTWGAVGDVPVVGDYDGDGKADIAVYRPTTGSWFFLKSSTNFVSGAGYSWGAVGDIPIPR